jgi:transcriptional regulator with XRE-family HTH domain
MRKGIYEVTTKLKGERLKRKYTQREMGDFLEIPSSVYSMYEQGSKKLASARLKTILKICIKLGVKMDKVIDDQETLKLLDEYRKVTR